MAIAGPNTHERAISAAGVVALHVALAAILAGGLATHIDRIDDRALKTFDVAQPPASPPVRASAPAPRREGAAAPANAVARPTPVVAPTLPLRSPLPAAVIAADATDATAGAAPLPGPGTGAGGRGLGNGAGRNGDGAGGGGGTRARRIAGEIVESDYPREAGRKRVGGAVTTAFTVGADGRVRDCRVSRSSGNAALDATTCRLIEARFRYDPARDAAGRPRAEERGWRQDWWIERAGRNGW